MNKRMRKMAWVAPAAIVGIAAFIAIGGTVVMLLWNWLAPMLFGLPMVTFWQAIGLLALGRILFGGGIMPPFGGELSDVEIASVGTYIRNNWGNQFGAISPEKVAAARQTLSGGNAQNPPRAQGATQ